MVDSGQLHTWPRHAQRKSPQYPFTRKLGCRVGPRASLNVFVKQKNLFPLPGDKPRFLDYAACSTKMYCIWKHLKTYNPIMKIMLVI